MSARTKDRGNSSKHTGTSKHHKDSKHTHHHHREHHHGHHPKAHHVARHPHHAKARGFAVGDLLPVCALEAVAMSLRLAGQPVPDDDVAGLWELCGGRGLTIAEALAAAARFGLAGCRPVDAHQLSQAAHVAPVDAHARGAVENLLGEHVLDHFFDDFAVIGPGGRIGEYARGVNPSDLQPFIDLAGRALDVHALILGIDVPGPHCVLATADGWWSWGELHSPWPARVEEAWAVSWP